MAQSVIGALRVVLGMNAGEFKKGSKDAEGRLDRLGRKFGITAKNAKIAGAAMGAAIGAAAAAIGVAVNRALLDFDKLTKLSRSIGVPVEEMSKLQHAAELSGASIEELGRAFRNVARNMQGAARAPTDFSRSLDALNVSWRDANGNFRRADELMLDVADKFAGMEDGAGKTALAMKIFGEEMGPRLVSMLNAGSGGIKEMTAEAERLGLAFDTQAGEAAERFNDQMDRIGKVTGGFGTTLTVKILPALERIINKFADWATSGDGVKGMAEDIAEAFTGIVVGVTKASTHIDNIWLQTKAFAHNTKDLVTGAWSAIAERNGVVAARIAKTERDLADEVKQIWDEFAQSGSGWRASIEGGGDAGASGKPPIVAGLEQQNAALQLVNEAERERLRIMEAMRSPYEVMIDRQARLNEVFAGGAVNAQAFAKASQMAAYTMQNSYAQAASAVSGALSNLFKENKGIAIAHALINTYEAVTAALKNPPGPPFSYAYAAAALANGMAQVAAIRSTNKSGSGGGGSAAGGAGGATQAAAPQPQQSFFIDLQGQSFGRDQVRGLIDNINDAISDGAVIRMSAA